jgi:hypothetical protein
MVRNIFLFCLAFLLAPLIEAQELAPLPAQPEGVAWPTHGWETGDLPEDTAGTIRELLRIAMVGGRHDLGGETRAVVIIHRGKLVAEVYREGFGPDTRQMSWSLAKSVTSALVGRAVQLGLIGDIDAPMPGLFAEDDPRAAITWRQWITMTDGLEYHEFESDILEQNDVARMMYGAGRFDVVGYIRQSFPLQYTPGTRWNYSTASFSLVGRALQGLIGIEIPVLEPRWSKLRRKGLRRRRDVRAGRCAHGSLDPTGPVRPDRHGCATGVRSLRHLSRRLPCLGFGARLREIRPALSARRDVGRAAPACPKAGST